MTEIEVPEGQETTLCIFLNIQAGKKKKKGSKQEKRTLGMRLQIAICVLAT